jgi:hypothetical protein
MRRALLLSIVAVAMLQAPIGILSDARAASPLEYYVKAAYLTKFFPFITWPESAFPVAKEPVTICVLGDDPFGSALNQAAAADPDGEHQIAVKHISEPDPTCQIEFLHFKQVAAAKVALATIANAPVVTVTDSDMPVAGVIHFKFDQGRVRFEIDQAAASRAGLVISSKLLSLARTVRQ